MSSIKKVPKVRSSRAWRVPMVAFVVVALIGSLLAVTAPVAVAPASAQGESTHTEWQSACIGRAAGIGQAQTEPLGFTVTHPASVEPDTEFTVRIDPDEGYLPDKTFNPIVGEVTVFGLNQIRLMFNLPANSEVLDVQIVPDSTYNTAGPYTVEVDDSFSPPRIVLYTQEVVKNPSLPDGSTPFSLPSIDVTVQATGPIGSNISTRVSGFNENTSGYTFTADNSHAVASVRCWAEGEIPAPIIFQTSIGSGGEAQPTTTELSVSPTLLPAGNQVTMNATVTAPNGVVRFNDGGTTLGLAELDVDGNAEITAALNNVGQRSLTATYLGSAGFEASTSDPVAVTVTDPTDRDPVQLTMTADPARISLVNNNNTAAVWPVSIDVAVDPTAGGSPPTGDLRLWRNGDLVATQQLVDGSTTFETLGALGPNLFRAEYAGDVDYFSGAGTVVVPGTTTGFTLDRPLSGTVDLNNVDGPVPPDSVLSASYVTDSDGTQIIDPVVSMFVFPSATYAIAGGGSLTGTLVQTGETEGGISNVWDPGTESWLPDADMSLATTLSLQVASADFNDGNGMQDFGSSCLVGPFDVDLAGTRTGTNGPATLTPTEPFSVPFASAGSCVNDAGVSRAGKVGAALAGAFTADFELTLTPPAAAAATQISPVTVTPAELSEASSFGQPVTLSATLSRIDGANLPVSSAGQVEFYANGNRVGAANTPFAFFVPEKTVSIAFPGSNPVTNPLPQGPLDLQARFVPNPSNGPNGWGLLATSPLSDPVGHTVLPPIAKQTPTVTLEVPEVASTGQPVTIDVNIDPAPNAAPGAAPLAGAIRIYDDNAPLGEELVPITSQLPFGAGGGMGIDVSASSDGHYQTQTALAPGIYSLRAEFTPDFATSAWGWNPAGSDAVSHTVVGAQTPTALTITGDSTRGTGQIPLGQQGYVEVQIDPAVVGSVGPWTPQLYYLNPFGSTLNSSFNEQGRATATIFTNNQVPGTYEARLWFDPTVRGEDGVPSLPSNQGFLPSEVTFSYDVVDPAVSGPLETGTEVVSVTPSVAQVGETWSQVNGYVTFNAAGSVSYTARNVDTSAVTNLGSANVNTSTGTTGRGLARLSNPAVTAGLPAGTYEVRGNFTPTNPALWQASGSEAFIVHVADEAVVTETVLSVSPEGTSSPGQGVTLEATVSPTYASAGTVEFFDGESSLGSVPTGNGSASLMVFDLTEGEHSLSAAFTPTDELDATSSESDPVTHTVATPTVPTETVLAVVPEGSSDEGTDVTLTATVTPADAVGDVVFEDESGELGTVALVEGSAELVLSDLPPGVHELQAIFEPDPESDFEASASEVVEHEVIAENTPAPPLDVSATGGGLMATVTWDAPEDDGGSAITGYVVHVIDSPQTLEDVFVEVSGHVTTVDVLGLTAGEDYVFTVEAVNANGTSDPSEESNTVTVGEAQEFPDVQPGHPFFAEITWMAEVGLSTGFTDGEYKPNLTLTRQAMSAFLYRLNGSPDGASPECTVAPFPDVPVSNPFCGEIAWMAETGISEGYDDGTYRPEDGLTRQAMSAFLYRSANGSAEPPACSAPPFTDVPVTNEFCPEIAWMADTGISEGWPDGTYRPMEDLTRQAMSAFLYRYTLVVQTVIV